MKVQHFSLSSNHGPLFQYLATITGAFSVISSGINLGWTSPYLPKLLSNSSSIPTTNNEGSWCAVMPLLGAPPGAIIAAVLVDKIGRKSTTLWIAPIIAVCFSGIAFAESITVISVIRLIIGASEGALYTVLPIYIGEISEPQIRGFLTSTIAIFSITGTLFINVIGLKTSIFVSSLICVSIPVIHFIGFFWMPESPYYLIKKNCLVEAKDSLRILRGTRDVDEEMESLIKAVTRQEQTKRAKITDLLTVPSNRKACFIFIIICLTNKFSGKNPCLFYTSMIFEEAGSSISSELSTVIYCCVELVATLIAIVVVDRFGKRLLLITSTIGCSLSIFSLASYFFIKTNYTYFIEILDWLPITSLVSYNILFSIGLAFGPVSVLSELFPTNIKAIALCGADTFSVTMGAIASKFFQITKDEFGMFVPFWVFSCCCLIGLVFIMKFVPETKGKTLEEVQLFLIGAETKKNTTESA